MSAESRFNPGRRFDAGGVAAKAFGAWLKLFAPLTLFNAALFVPVLLIVYLLPIDSDDPESATKRIQILGFIPALWGMLAGVVLGGATAAAVVRSLRGESTSIADAIRIGFSKFGPLLALGALMFGPWVVGAGICMAFGPLGYFVILIGVVPYLIFTTTYGVSGAALVAENLDVRAAMRRSRELTAERRGSYFGALFIIGLVAGVAGAVFTAVFVPSPAKAGGVAAIVAAFRNSIALGLVPQILFGALYGVANAVAYHDLRVDKEGASTEDLVKIFG